MNVIDYFQAPINYFWQWEEGGEVIVVTGGSTIGYRGHIANLLNSIAPLGLPSFGSFLLVMVATNDTLDDSLQYIKDILKNHFVESNISFIENSEDFIDCFSFLRLLNQLPKEYKIGKRREILFQTIFSKSHNAIAIKTSIGVASHLNEMTNFRTKLLTKKPFNYNFILKEFKVLSLMYRKFPTMQSIIEAMGDLPELDEGELPLLEIQNSIKTDFKDFVDELIDNFKTFEVGTLIKLIWAGFNIPIFNAHPSEQPLGGVSDLSNKGNFDKLLVSEFANDDLVFMSRIANNEALYLHREMPPITDKLQRIILIDISIKAWGTPKILAYATYLAIAKHPKAVTESQVFVIGSAYIPVFCNDIGEIIDGLQNVDVSLHSGVGLASFLEANKANKQLEIFYITTAEGLKYPAVQKQLADYRTFFKYIITTNVLGEINFYLNISTAQKHLQTIRLPLAKLWTKNKRNGEKKIHEVIEKPTLQSPLPMLLPTPKEIKKIMLLDDDVYIVANKCLMKRTKESHDKNNKGWELCLKNIATNGIYEIGRQENGDIVFLSFNTPNREIVIYNLNTEQSAKEKFVEWRYDSRREFVYHAECFVKIFGGMAYTISLVADRVEIKKGDLGIPIYDVYSKRKMELEKPGLIPSQINILKNIKSIYINKDNYLVFNGHQLSFYFNKGLMFSNFNNNASLGIVAKQTTSRREFWFTDGSLIMIDSNGFFTLKSGDSSLPEIYIITTIESNLGMATLNNFAGNLVYYNEDLSQVSVFLEDSGENKISATKIVKLYSGLGLADAKRIIDEAPQLIPNKIGLDEAIKMIGELKAINCIAKILPSKNTKQDIISAEKFYQLYIAKFIQNIINHAASSKAE